MDDQTIHYIGFIRRRAGMSHADFSAHWGTTHRDLVMEFADPGPILQYVQDVGLETPPEDFRSDFDGAPELWIRNEQALAELFAAEGFQYAYAVDSPLFITMPAISFFVADKVMHEGPADGFKLMRLVGTPVAQEADRFAEEWLGSPCPLGMPGQSPLRMVRSRILSAEAEGTDATAYFGIESSWWPDAQTAVAAWRDRDVSRVPHEQVLLARERVVMALATEPHAD